MNVVSSELWYDLAAKMALTATIVVIISVAVERSGPLIGALIAAADSAAAGARRRTARHGLSPDHGSWPVAP